jgi:hypothetical protein
MRTLFFIKELDAMGKALSRSRSEPLSISFLKVFQCNTNSVLKPIPNECAFVFCLLKGTLFRNREQQSFFLCLTYCWVNFTIEVNVEEGVSRSLCANGPGRYRSTRVHGRKREAGGQQVGMGVQSQ